MAEYIEREALKNDIAKSTEPFNTGSVFRAINRQIAADVVPVVRCKDCKHAYINSFAVSSGEALCTLSGQPMQQDDFCSYGERKDGGDG